MRWFVRVIAAAVVLAAGMGTAQAPAPKLALVIGVSDYTRTLTPEEQAAGFVVPKALPNAVRDATLVADALEAQGYTVTRLSDPDKRAMLAALSTFSSAFTRAGPDAVGVFYFAGHGAQGRPALERDIDNYLIPRNTALITEVDLESEALALSRVSATLKPAPRGAMVLILDACRDFALPAANRSGAVTRGLAEARAAPGTMIAYATSPGSTALDGPAGGNGPYARALATEVRGAQGATLEQVFISVRNKVLAETRETQLPWENSSLRRSVTLGIGPDPRLGPLHDLSGATAREAKSRLKDIFVPLDDVYAALESEESQVVIVLDAARSNPWGSHGLARNSGPRRNTWYVSSAFPGTLAEGTLGGNSLFTAVFKKWVVRADLPLWQRFRDAGSEIRSRDPRANMWASSTMIGDNWGKTPPRLALVIGNSDYNLDGDLTDPGQDGFSADSEASINDARAMRDAIATIGFRDVLYLENADRAAIADGLYQLSQRARAAGPGASVFVYYSGHALELEGENFLIPVGVRVAWSGGR